MALPVRDRRDRDASTWNPLTELDQTARRLAGLVDEARGFGWPSLGLSAVDEFLPPADLEETDEAYIVDVELPGVSKKDVDVEVTGRRVTVTGERKERERAGILRRRARTVGRFFYEVTLPGDVDEDGVNATLDNGVLTITVPKAASERRQRRKIPVS